MQKKRTQHRAMVGAKKREGAWAKRRRSGWKEAYRGWGFAAGNKIDKYVDNLRWGSLRRSVIFVSFFLPRAFPVAFSSSLSFSFLLPYYWYWYYPRRRKRKTNIAPKHTKKGACRVWYICVAPLPLSPSLPLSLHHQHNHPKIHPCKNTCKRALSSLAFSLKPNFHFF